MFSKILIYGFGLMGGSLALAIRNKGLASCVSGVFRNEKSLLEAKKLGYADDFFLEQDFLERNLWNQFDFIIFGLPVDIICQRIQAIPQDYPGYLTDLGSTKISIIQSVESKFSTEHNYYSSHPMTGSENSGVQFSKEGLYEGKLCILTAPTNLRKEAQLKIREFWERIGSRIIDIPAQDHDEILAYLSHSPHILSSLLVTWVGQNEKVMNYNKLSNLPLSGGGFRDMSRIAGSNPEMWEAIIQTNRKSIHQSLIDFRIQLDELILAFEREPENNSFWRQYFEKAKEHRNQILKL
jgi:prephenate dehydrogenase